jgi:hypothetical protein
MDQLYRASIKDEENSLHLVAPFIDHALNPKKNMDGFETTSEAISQKQMPTFSGLISNRILPGINSLMNYEIMTPPASVR